MTDRLGFSGRVARAFQSNPLTPVLALAGLLLGLAAVWVTPREEEPQIDVTMANVTVPFPGASVEDVENLVSYPLEQVLSEIEGVRHVYSASRPGVAALTVEFQVGVPRQTAIVRLYNQVYANADWAPPGLGVGQPLVRPMGIDDVPVMALTLWTEDAERGATELAEVAHTLETELKRVPGTRDVYTLGAPDRAVLVQLDSARLAAYGLAAEDLVGALRAANGVAQAGERIGAEGVVPVTAGTFLADADAVAELVIGLHQGKPVYLTDVAQVTRGADVPTQYVWYGAPARRAGPAGIAPAVTLAIAKQPGRNAADITAAIAQRMQSLRGSLIPEGVQYTITRDYGQTATDKAEKLIHKLIFATSAVVLLVLVALGWREAAIVGTAVVVTLALTLFASWAMGFTLNRVSLFALIFAIGILVDDAIVVVENIHRHVSAGARSLREAIAPAVDEVGGPTILATFTVIAALLPMAFVTGLMGPYMRPIPINASVGMLLSLAVALVVTPWLSAQLLRAHTGAADHASHSSPETAGTAQLEPTADASNPQRQPVARRKRGPKRALSERLRDFFERLLRPFLDPTAGRRRRRMLFAATGVMVLLAVGLVAVQAVVLKMLPFDNKSEFQVMVDLPEGRTLEDTSKLLAQLAAALDAVPEVRDYQAYAGTSAPMTFNGLVRQYYLRRGANVGDLQVNLLDAHQRHRQSHDIARAVRPLLAQIAAKAGAAIKVVELPPGPPVMAPIVAEIHAPTDADARAVAAAMRDRFAATAGIVDIDTSVEADSPREIVVVDRARAAHLGVSQASIVQTLQLALSGLDATYLRDGASKYAVPLRLRLPTGDQASMDALLAMRVRAGDGGLVPLSELVRVQRAGWERAIWHKDLLPVVYVTGDEAGASDSPLYGMFNLVGQVADNPLAGHRIAQHFIAQPARSDVFAVKWDGEWQITYETFRDMGIAYAVGLVLIYLLVVAQFRSYLVPLVIMAPIPLTAIGVMPGHALLGAPFTATSMIGMIALAGIIVRNSILLVDFINKALAKGQALEDAVIEACAVRAQPIVLTALAAMLGAFFILDDPIFNGLAIALIFGLLVATGLTLIMIPLLYYAMLSSRPSHGATS